MILTEQFIDLWQNVFTGDKKLVFFIGFCILTFAFPFLCIWLSCGMVELYFRIFLRRKYPEKWMEMREACVTKGFNFYYKNWLKGQSNSDDPFCKIWHIHDMFGKLCLGIWLIIVLVVGITALAKNYM